MHRLITGVGSGCGLDRGDAKALGGPADIEADGIALAKHFDAGCATAEWGADDRDEGKLEGDFAAAVGAHDPAPARAVKNYDEPGIEIPWKSLAVVFVAQGSGSIRACVSAQSG